MSDISMKQLLEAGVHFGHQTSRWNPKMKPYIFGARNGIHIIDLQQTVTMFKELEAVVRDLATSGGMSFSSVPKSRPKMPFVKKPSAVTCITSIIVGLAAP